MDSMIAFNTYHRLAVFSNYGCTIATKWLFTRNKNLLQYIEFSLFTLFTNAKNKIY